MIRWTTYDHRRLRPMSIPEQIGYNFSLPYWKLMSRLTRMGFLWTEESNQMRLRDLTFKFWKVLLHRQEKKYLGVIATKDEAISNLETKFESDQARLVICLTEIVRSTGGKVVVTPETMRDSLGWTLETNYDPVTKEMTYEVINHESRILS
jgi:hypothetical protein